jgi:hypothetical protein
MNFLLPKIIAFTFVLTGMITCTKKGSCSYDMPTIERDSGYKLQTL